MCLVRFSVQTDVISLNSVNRLIDVTVKCGVFFAARTEFLNIIQTIYGFKAVTSYELFSTSKKKKALFSNTKTKYCTVSSGC
jgi:hypothetical protein